MNIIKQLKRDLIDNYSTDDLLAMARLHKLNADQTPLDTLIDRIASANLRHSQIITGKMIPSNILQELVLQYPDENWNWYYLSENPLISFEFIDAHPEFEWNWCSVSENPNVTLDIIEARPDLPWDWSCVTSNPNITMDIIESRPDLPWDDEYISANPNLTVDFIKNHLDKPWDWDSLSRANINIEFVKENIDKPWDWYHLSENANITMDDVKDNLDFPWVKERLSQNPNLTLDIIELLPDKDDISAQDYEEYSNQYWNWYHISKNPAITMEMIEDHLNDKYYKWIWIGVSQNPNLTIDFIKKHLDKGWYWMAITSHPNITIEDIEDNPKLPWNLELLGYNFNIPIEDIEKYKGKFVIWSYISKRPDITKELIDKYVDNISFYELSKNTFGLDMKKQARTEKYTTDIMAHKDDDQERAKRLLDLQWGELCKELNSTKNLSELRGMAKAMGIKGYQRKTKKELCAAIGAQVVIYHKIPTALGALQE